MRDLKLNQRPGLRGDQQVARLMAAIFIIAVVLVAVYFYYKIASRQPVIVNQVSVVDTSQINMLDTATALMVPNFDNLDRWLVHYGIIDSDIREIIMAQAAIESGYFTSYRCVVNNNCFNMARANIRIQTATAIDKTGFAIYPNFAAGIEDYARYFKANYSGGDYYQFLSAAKFAEDSTYISKLKQIVTSKPWLH